MSFTPNHPAERRGEWVISTYCTASSCVEVRLTPQLVSVRDSKQNPDAGAEDGTQDSQPILDVQPQQWLTFLSEVLEDIPVGSNGSLFFEHRSDGDVLLTSTDSEVTLRYDAEEWQAFLGGVADGEFGPIRATA